MTFDEFQNSTTADAPSAEMSLVLQALWWDAKGNWTKAHECAQQRETVNHARVHAYLHRREGDLDNARYWYGRAGRKVFAGPLQEEWQSIVKALIEQSGSK